MDDLKQAWIQAGKSLVIALNDLGVSLYKTATTGVNAAVEWAKKDNPHIRTDGVEVDTESAPETTAEQAVEADEKTAE